MAEIIRKFIDDTSLYSIWKITESVEELHRSIALKPSEEELYQSFVAESRKKQWLAYRILIRKLLEPQDFPVEYDEAGKPFLAGSHYHISVSHTGNLAAVIISSKGKVGIDLEKIRPRNDEGTCRNRPRPRRLADGSCFSTAGVTPGASRAADSASIALRMKKRSEISLAFSLVSRLRRMVPSRLSCPGLTRACSNGRIGLDGRVTPGLDPGRP